MPSGSVAEALLPNVTTVEIGVSALRFNYAEFDDAGVILDKEQGSIPGLSFRFTQKLSDWEAEGVASYHYGRVSYTGQDTYGVPVDTSTDEEVGDFALRLGRWFDDGSYPVMPYAGLGYHRWDRTILPVSNVSGLFESYRWKYTWLGVKIIAYQQGASNLMLDVGWIKPFNPAMSADVYNVNLNLGNSDGLRLMLTSHVALDENTTLSLEPYFEYWRLGRSPNVTAYQGCALHATPCIIYEPTSETKNFGVNLRLGRAF